MDNGASIEHNTWLDKAKSFVDGLNSSVLAFTVGMATGNLGAPIAVYLNENGYDVIAVGHRTSDNGFFGEIGVPYYSVNIEREEDFNKLPTKDIYAVAHFASSLPSRYEYDPVELFESITIGTLNVLKWMNKIGCKKIVFPQTPSDMDSYHNCGKVIPEDKPREFPLTGDHAVYTIAKNAAVDLIDHYHAEFGFSRFIFRFFTIYEYHPNPYHYRNYKHLMMPFRMLMDRASKGLPIELSAVLDYSNAEACNESIIAVEKAFMSAVNKAVEQRLKGIAPIEKAPENQGISTQEFRKMTIAQRTELKQTNPELYEQLKGR